MKKVGLVLEGGAMRGLFTAGVIDVFMENGIEFDAVVGVSAGAAFGVNIKSHQIGRALRYNLKYCKDKRYCSMHSLIKTGDMFGAEFCYHTLPEKLDKFDTETYDNSPMKFYCVCTDVMSGKAVYHLCDKANYETYEWIRASASMPLVSNIVKIGDDLLLDGGIADSIPLSFMQNEGYQKNVVVLTQPKNYIKGKNKMMPLIRNKLGQYSNLVKAVDERHIIYNKTTRFVKEQEALGRAFVIRPEDSLPVGRVEHNPTKLQKTYDIGRKAAFDCLDELQKFMECSKK